jgi:hypothetical protein
MILLAAAAFADEPVVYADDPAIAVHKVSLDAGVPVWELQPVRPSELVSGDVPQAIGVDQPPSCASIATTTAALRETLTRVEDLVAYQRFPQSRALLGTALASLACLADPAEASVTARVLFLDGIAAEDAGDLAAAAESFRGALAFQPALAWDEAMAPELRVGFDQAVAAAASAPVGTLVVGPGVEGVASLWIDGRLVAPVGNTVPLSVGPHLVQLLAPGTVQTLSVVIRGDSPVALLVPSSLSDRVVTQGSPDRRALVTAIVDARFAKPASFYVWTGARTVRYDGAGWVELPMSEAEGLAARRRAGHDLVLGGGVTAGVGLAATAAGLGLWLSSDPHGAPDNTREYLQRLKRSVAGATLFDGGLVAVGLGTVTLGVGVGVGSPGVTVAWKTR